MHRILPRYLAIPCLLALLPALHAQDPYVEGEVLVILKADTPADAPTPGGSQAWQFTKLYSAVAQSAGAQVGLVRVPGRTTAELLAELSADPRVEVAEPNYLWRISRFTPDDTEFASLWGLDNTAQEVNGVTGVAGVDVRALDGWNLLPPVTDEIVVGVIDTGIDPTHPDLVNNLWINSGEIPDNGVDDDGNGYVDDVHGYDFSLGTGTLTDAGEHGTHVSGTIAATGRNALGVIGVAYQARVLAMKASENGRTLPTADILEAMNYAIALKKRGVNIVAVNASYGGPSFSYSVQRAVNAMRDLGIIICAAAGNDGMNNDSYPQYPSSYPTNNIISVAALDSNNTIAYFSNYGIGSVDIAAPGVNIYSTVPTTASEEESLVTLGTTDHPAQAIGFSARTPSGGVNGMLFDCGLGRAGDFPAGVKGQLAAVRRGELDIATQVANAAAAGAKGVVICDDTDETLASPAWTLGAAGNWIPAVRVTRATGEALLASLPKTASLVRDADRLASYDYLDGTSMAAPHVSGAVALAALCYPEDTLTQRVNRIIQRSTLVPGLLGVVKSNSRLNLRTIIDSDNDKMPDWWEIQNFGSTAVTAAGDADGDGYTNLEEFLASTEPQNSASRFALAKVKSGSETGISGDDVVLTFPTAVDRSYQLEWTDNIAGGEWTVIGDPITGTGGEVQVVDEGALSRSDRNFYRLRLLDE